MFSYKTAGFVDKIILMPIFDFKEFEPTLQTLVAGYDKATHTLVIQYYQQTHNFLFY